MRKADVIFYKLSQLSTNDPTLNDPKKVTEIAAVNNIGAATNTSKNPPKNPTVKPEDLPEPGKGFGVTDPAQPEEPGEQISNLKNKPKWSKTAEHKGEGYMAKYDALECSKDSRDVFRLIDESMNLPEWLEAKITKASDYMNDVKDYLSNYPQSEE